MSQKDYKLIAKVFAGARTTVCQDGELMRALLAEAMARALAAENPRFDRARFLRACEVEEAPSVLPPAPLRLGRPWRNPAEVAE